MKLIMQWLSVLSLTLVASACNNEKSIVPVNDKSSAPENAITDLMRDNNDQFIWQEATIVYLDVEGGFYGLVTKDGEQLLPINLTAEFQQIGAKVKVRGDIIKDMMTIHQWGEPFTLVEIEWLKPESKTTEYND